MWNVWEYNKHNAKADDFFLLIFFMLLEMSKEPVVYLCLAIVSLSCLTACVNALHKYKEGYETFKLMSMRPHEQLY